EVRPAELGDELAQRSDVVDQAVHCVPSRVFAISVIRLLSRPGSPEALSWTGRRTSEPCSERTGVVSSVVADLRLIRHCATSPRSGRVAGVADFAAPRARGLRRRAARDALDRADDPG